MTPEKEQNLAIAYQRAFAGTPWYEVGKTKLGSFTDTPVGSCSLEHKELIELEAYPSDEVVATFRKKVLQEEGILSIEENFTQDNLITSLYWETTPQDLFEKKYSPNSLMQEFLNTNLDQKCVYLDEIFTSFLRESGNLWNLKNNIETIQKITETKQLCFRTINQKLIQKIQKDFPNSKLFDPNQSIPDNRYFIIINF